MIEIRKAGERIKPPSVQEDEEDMEEPPRLTEKDVEHIVRTDPRVLQLLRDHPGTEINIFYVFQSDVWVAELIQGEQEIAVVTVDVRGDIIEIEPKR